MLNRRHLRVKVLQCLYAFFQSGNSDLDSGKKELLHGIEKIYELYLYQFSLLKELLHIAEVKIEEKRNKKLPGPDDLNPNTRFIENPVLRKIKNSENLLKAESNHNISWSNQRDIISKLFKKLQESNLYKKYLNKSESSYREDKDFVINIFVNDVCTFELLHSFYEETSIYWLDDWELVNKMIIKTLKTFNKADEADIELLNLYKDPKDKDFAIELFNKTVLNSKEFDPLISKRTKNWDIDRIALMDILIMKMAITEFLKFPEIPVRVSLNEYIELSKMYSTPKSKVFVNGVLDKLVEEFYSNKEIDKYSK